MAGLPMRSSACSRAGDRGDHPAARHLGKLGPEPAADCDSCRYSAGHRNSAGPCARARQPRPGHAGTGGAPQRRDRPCRHRQPRRRSHEAVLLPRSRKQDPSAIRRNPAGCEAGHSGVHRRVAHTAARVDSHDPPAERRLEQRGRRHAAGPQVISRPHRGNARVPADSEEPDSAGVVTAVPAVRVGSRNAPASSAPVRAAPSPQRSQRQPRQR